MRVVSNSAFRATVICNSIIAVLVVVIVLVVVVIAVVVVIMVIRTAIARNNSVDLKMLRLCPVDSTSHLLLRSAVHRKQLFRCCGHHHHSCKQVEFHSSHPTAQKTIKANGVLFHLNDPQSNEN